MVRFSALSRLFTPILLTQADYGMIKNSLAFEDEDVRAFQDDALCCGFGGGPVLLRGLDVALRVIQEPFTGDLPLATITTWINTLLSLCMSPGRHTTAWSILQAFTKVLRRHQHVRAAQPLHAVSALVESLVRIR